MARISKPQVAACIIIALLFAAMAFQATGFKESARWFPLYATVAGAVIAALAAAIGLVQLAQGKAAALSSRSSALASKGSADKHAAEGDFDPAIVLKGLGWLGIWLAYVLLSLLVGYMAASVIWIGLWFRIVHKWPAHHVAMAAGAVLALLILANTKLDVPMPGGWGVVNDLWLGE